ncbi:glycosyltransferase family 2 protein [Myroides marinus]|uniref:glycosyltransferase family 2 protein n=1 Tax=Myroides marinus TaxID=703342 RepID=UPI00257884D6|nr:glycosyltransferase [Myroides marinus]MDM1370039.1 glycosyltransferase [Myroides marinus]MDM1534078.1 glycosyltransferase [Myroides marinus]MDM1541042.1 glycosyltransferase [Myroides marinus]
MNSISFVIVSYISQELLRDCIESIIKECEISNIEYEIIVVDNSPNEYKEIVRLLIASFNIPIMYIPSKNIGYGAGNNLGCQSSKNDIICIINPDVRLKSYTLKYVFEKLNNDLNLALLGGKQIGGRNISFYLLPEFFVPFLSALIVFISNRFNLFSSRLFFLSGACFFMPREKFDEVGGFDSNIFLYHEESDLSKRILANHYKIEYDKRIEYIHEMGERKNLSDKTFICMLESLFYYLNKYGLSVKRVTFFKKIYFRFTDKRLYKLFCEFYNKGKL